MHIAIAVAAMILASQFAHAGEQTEKKKHTATVNLLSNCGGFYEFLAVVSEEAGKPEVAEQFRGSARGAKLSAAYILSVEAAGDGRERKLGEFAPYVDSLAELSKGQMLAFRELGDDGPIKERGDLCMAALEVQKALVQEMRDQMIDR